MASIEDADDLALEILRGLKNWAERAWQRNSGIGHQGLKSRFEKIIQKLKNGKDGSSNQVDTDAAALEEELTADEEEFEREQATPYKDLAFESEEDLAFLQNELMKANIEHAFDPNCFDDENLELHYNKDKSLSSFVGPVAWDKNPVDGMYHLYVPDRDPALSMHLPFSRNDIEIVESHNKFCRLENASDELKALMSYFDADQAQRRYAVSEACKSAGAVAERSLSGDTFNLDFKTVQWDKDATILSDRLDELNIPYAKELSANGQTMRFSFDKAYCPDVREVADMLQASNIKGLNSSRFANLAELDRSANMLDGMTAVQQHGPFTLEQAHLYTQMLDSAGVPYESIHDKKTQQVSFLVRDSDLSERAHIISDMQGTEALALDSLQQTEAKANQIAQSREGNTKVQRKNVERVVKEEQQRKIATQTRPHQERSQAIKSADAQKHQKEIGARTQERSR